MKNFLPSEKIKLVHKEKLPSWDPCTAVHLV